MKKFIAIPGILFLSFLLSSCEAIGAIFKTGVGVGVFLVIAVVVVIIFFVARGSKNK